MDIESKTYKKGIATQMSVTVSNDNGLRDENGTARLDYCLYTNSNNVVADGNVNVGGTFCNGWDGSVNAAFNYIANYLGVVIL
jgi:hypothetical protein